jgi:hypothetical protein
LDPLLGQRASSWSRGLYPIMVLKDHSIKGIRQGNIRLAPVTRNIAPVKVLNHLGLKTSPWTGHWDSIPSRSAQEY